MQSENNVLIKKINLLYKKKRWVNLHYIFAFFIAYK